nr:telethonin [Nothobranchius furzeri]
MHCVSRGGVYLLNSYCELQEDNQEKKETYQACWLDLVLETRAQYRLTLSETHSLHRESYTQQQVVHFIVWRSPSQALMLGREGGVLTEHQLPSNTSAAAPTEGCVPLRGRDIYPQEVLSKPEGVDFRAMSLVSPLRETSHQLQKRE